MSNIKQIEVKGVVYDVKDASAEPSIPGKGLSTNDYTNEDKAKLSALPSGSELDVELGGKVDKTPGKGLSTNDYDNNAKALVDALPTAIGGIQQTIQQIDELIPAQATPQNQLADKAFVNSSIGTATATFRGTFNLITDLSLTTSATREQIAATLLTAVSTADNNDYVFVQIPAADADPTVVSRVERYKFNGTSWAYEWSLNNSSFTASQWAAINSGITSADVSKLDALPTNTELQASLASKYQKPVSGIPASDLASGVIPDVSGFYSKPSTGIPKTDLAGEVQTSLGKADTAYQKPSNGIPATDLSSGVQTSLDKADTAIQPSDLTPITEVIPSAASNQNQLADKAFVNSSISTATATFRGTYNLVSDLHLTTSATREQVATALASEIATADNNDYCFVQIPTADATPSEIARVDRYKFDGTAWAYEWSLNNSSFTASQWAALNSGITSGLVSKLSDLPTNSELTNLLAGKQPTIDNNHKLDYSLVSNTPPSVPTPTSADENKVLGVTDPQGTLGWVPQTGGGGSANAVLYTQQSLTNSQKAQARENIGVLSPQITYTPSGDVNPSVTPANYATREEFNEVAGAIGEPLSETNSKRESVELTLVRDKFINPQGQVENSGNAAYSSPVFLKRGQTIRSVSNWGAAAISLTDATGSYYTPVVISGSGLTIAEYTALSDCYVALSGETRTMGADIETSTAELFEDVEQVGVESETEKSVPEFELVDDKFIGGNGSVGDDNRFCYTTPIFLQAGDTIEFDFIGGFNTASIAEVVIADKKYTAIETHAGDVASLTHETYTALADIWVALCGISIVNVTIGHATPKQVIVPLSEFLEGFEASSKDPYKDLDYFEIPIPKKATLNVVAEAFSTSKSDIVEAVIEYSDPYHNVNFSRNCTLTAQGSSSMSYIEKNQTLDFSDCKIKFGDWVAQDSFHLKAYYIDVFRGINNAMLNFAESVIRLKGCRSNRVLSSGTTSTDTGAGNFFTDFGTDALCHPDGFPVEVYLNGEYYGLFAWNLKKHRDNYSMNKNNAAHILMDGEMGSNEFWGGSVNWTKFEIRNPKGLVTMNGNDYDGEAPLELIDSTSTYYDSSNANHVRSAAVKASILSLAGARSSILALSTTEAQKAAFAEMFDVPMFLVYYVVSQVIDNYDGFYKNWIWTMYSGKAAPNFYDMDSLFGRYWNGTRVFHAPNWGDVQNYTDSNSISHLFVSLYADEIATLYGELREAKVFTIENILRYLRDWLERIGREALKRNIDEWPTLPSYRPTLESSEPVYQDGTDSRYGMYDSVERVGLWLAGRITYLDNKYGYTE